MIDSVTIPWSSLFGIWEKDDPVAIDYFFSHHEPIISEGQGLAPYERLIMIHEIQADTNADFMDSLFLAAVEAFKALPEYAACDYKVDCLEIDFCEEGAYICL